ncbi:MAG: alpha/beta fold hydrolase [Anaerolineae bacterium]
MHYLRLTVILVCLLFAFWGLVPVVGAQPASQRDVTFGNGDITLTGTLVLPQGEGPFPAVVILHGSGPETRAPYTPDAEMLVEGGIAALIYDKRGTGGSSGDWRLASLDDLVADGLAAVHFLQDQPEIAADQVGILGSSQGAWLAPFSAARDDGVSFLVQITGSATPLANQEMWGTGNALSGLGFSERAIETAMKAQHLLYSARPLIQRGVLPLGDLWFVYYDPYLDPADAWSQVHVPALVLYGGQDPTVPGRTSLELVRSFWAEQGHPASRIAVFPQASHALGGASRNDNAAYSELVTSWIQAVVQGERIPEVHSSVSDIPAGPLRWYGTGASPTPWYATAGIQLALVLAFLLVSLLAILLSLIPSTGLRLPGLGVLPRVVLGLTGIVNLFLVVGLLLIVNYLLNADATSASPIIPLGAVLPPLSIVSLVLALLLVYVTFRAWRSRSWSGLVHILYTICAFVALVFVPFLSYWNLFAIPL